MLREVRAAGRMAGHPAMNIAKANRTGLRKFIRGFSVSELADAVSLIMRDFHVHVFLSEL
jgi:hypothetical protein